MFSIVFSKVTYSGAHYVCLGAAFPTEEESRNRKFFLAMSVADK